MTLSESAAPVASGGLDWDLQRIVGELRALRDASLAARSRLKPVKLPSRKALASIVEGLSAALFPNRLGSRELTTDSVDYFVGRTLDTALRELVEQLGREMRFAGESEGHDDQLREQAATIVREFATQLPAIRSLIESDIQAVFAGDPAARSIDEVLACYPGITAMMHHRMAHALFELGAPLVARIIAELAHATTGIDIHPGAKIDEGFFIDHGTGVVIGETAIIGRRVRLYHGVTLGAKCASSDESEANSGEPRHPIVEDDVVIYAGATLLGRIRIGRGSVIGGNVCLTHDVPPGSVVTQVEATAAG